MNNTENILLFSEKGRVFKLPVHKVPITEKNSVGIDIRILIKGLMSNIVKVINVGYSSFYKDIQVSDSDNTLASFVLDGDDVLLDEVIIRGNSLIRKKDHVVVIPDKIQ